MANEDNATIEKLQIRNRELDEALRLAISVIESYELDIRNSASYKSVGINLAEKGFCQGTVYTRAILLIKRTAGMPLHKSEQEVLDSND